MQQGLEKAGELRVPHHAVVGKGAVPGFVKHRYGPPKGRKVVFPLFLGRKCYERAGVGRDRAAKAPKGALLGARKP